MDSGQKKGQQRKQRVTTRGIRTQPKKCDSSETNDG